MIILQRIVCFLSFLFYSICSLAANQQPRDVQNAAAKAYSWHALYAYRTFDFKTKAGSLPGSFFGQSNLYVLGGNNFRLREKLSGGLFVYELDSHISLNVTPDINTKQLVQNQSIFGHLLQQMNDYFYIDFMAGMGQNLSKYNTFSLIDNNNDFLGYARAQSFDWFASLRAIYTRSWNDFLMIASVSGLHTEVYQHAFSYPFLEPLPTIDIAASALLSSFFLENLELNYKKYEQVQPFVNGGLIQVLQFTNKGAVIGALAAASTLPNINVDQNGFQLGAGVAFKYKKITLRLEEQYYQRGTVYHSTQSIASLKWNMD